MDAPEENIQTKTLESFKEFADVKQIFCDVVVHSRDPIMLEADLEKVTGRLCMACGNVYPPLSVHQYQSLEEELWLHMIL